VPRFGDEHVVFNPCACAALANIYTRLNRDYHSGFEFGGFSRNDRKSRIVITETHMMSGEVSKKLPESKARDVVSCRGINASRRNAGAYFINRSFLCLGSNIEYLFDFGL
jgi:hypothetical protein